MTTVKRLRREHDVMLRFGNALASEAAAFGRGDSGGLMLMRDVLRYLTEYPDRYHHPLEDAALWHLADRGLLARASAEALDFEHRALRYHGARLLQLLEGALADVLVPRPSVAIAAGQYADSLCGHVDHEELVLLPLLQEHLAPPDWEKIALVAAPCFEPGDMEPIEEHVQRLLASIAARTAGAAGSSQDGRFAGLGQQVSP